MKYDGLYADYWSNQTARVEALRKKISSGTVTAFGRLIPDESDLVIGTGRRLDATIMFTDICGFSNRQSSTADEQQMMLRVLNLYFTEMIRIVADYGGTVEKNTGDGLMAYFENEALGTVGENSTLRALSCAMTMQATNTHLIGPILRASNVLPIQFRTTIEYGQVTIAKMGAPRLFNTNTAIGNAVNFASKMLGWVTADQIGLGQTANSRIPVAWQIQHSVIAPVSTGWTYGTPPKPYPIYLYNGRWAKLL